MRRSSAAGASTGMPGAKTRMVVLLAWPPMPRELPTMSLFSTPEIRHPFVRACAARMRPPNSPCSSPASAAYTIVPSKR